ncbi:MAG TPA: class I SAM-dependent methyltransferase [Bradyrhizobium sp.]|uniref:class I SAM-dependent methyltransferase n=1 Tax=Bradyrhizobium sp. TaxID=376 RepID=UPI002CD5451A|nr:class I SAM-dependent methyltransferase [Bradyrhizobium sp.]HLZ03201.1 class I SAM-dependent methyltransferase [Bradyrhizobium sp.]
MSISDQIIRPASSHCRLCGHTVSTPALSLGRLPVCNRFTRTGQVDALVDVDIVECESCRLIQLREPPPAEALTPQLPWIRYREPEGHLDALVETVLALRSDARSALGTGPFEQPLLTRLAARGVATAALELDAPTREGFYPYLETWQASLNAPRLTEIAARKGRFDLVSCRYIIEHSRAPVAALTALKSLVGERGLLLIEVPDSSKFLAARDYCFLWDEHCCYFVENTLERLAEAAGFRVLSILRYPGVLEDALVAVLELAKSPVPALVPQGASALFQTYRERFPATRERLRAKLASSAGKTKNGVALFGIGHHAIMFVNAFGLGVDIALAVDDDPDKAGFFPPGFRVPVVSSEALLQDERIKICLFAVAPHIQAKVRAKLAPLAERGVEFRSIYAALDDSVVKELA